MALERTISVANPSPYERSDFVEVDLEAVGLPVNLDERTLRVFRKWRGRELQEIPFQIDYPFGRGIRRRILTLFSQNTPPGDPDYKTPTAEFLLQEGSRRDFSNSANGHVLKIEHYSALGVGETAWDSAKRIIGVKLFNGGSPTTREQIQSDGLQIYFSLVPRPEITAPINYSGAAPSILHHRAWKETDAPEVLAPYRTHPPEKRWGQLTHVDVSALPWERRSYQLISLLGEPGKEPEYELVWSNAGPLRATIALKSAAIHLEFGGSPYFQPDKRELICHLYRVISLYPHQEYYTEQLILRPEGAPERDRISLAFRAYYSSYLDFTDDVDHFLARFEDIPDYFAIWKSFTSQHRGYAFASDTHVRDVRSTVTKTRWRLDRSHEHRCVHMFLLHGFHEERFDRFHEIGHSWYERLLKPLRALPLNRYVSP